VAGRLIAGVAAGAATLALVCGGGGAARAQVEACPPPAYPGDLAPREAIAQWMAYRAALAALPRELPVMAALAESGLANLPGADSAGYFQMRTAIWNQGAYAGFPQNPDLQLQWFVDQAVAVRQARLAAAMPDPAATEADYGAWVADVERPAEQARGIYQPRLAEARALIGGACVPAALDTIAPAVSVAIRERQRALHRGAIVVTVGCPDEPCTASAFATLRLPRARRPPLVVALARAVPAGHERTLRFALRGELRRRVRRALRERGSFAATLRLTLTDAAGNRSARRRTPRITG